MFFLFLETDSLLEQSLLGMWPRAVDSSAAPNDTTSPVRIPWY